MMPVARGEGAVPSIRQGTDVSDSWSSSVGPCWTGPPEQHCCVAQFGSVGLFAIHALELNRHCIPDCAPSLDHARSQPLSAHEATLRRCAAFLNLQSWADCETK